MIGLAKLWKSVTGQGEVQPPAARLSSIPRDVTAPRPTLVAPPDDLDVAPSETRGADRFVPNRTSTVLTTTAGKRIAARIINISRTGVAVEAELSDVSAAEVATVGTRPVLPGRRIALGTVFLFKKPLDPKLCGPDIVL